MLDLRLVVHELRLELQKVENAITNMERLRDSGQGPERRGRRSMGLEERKEVSERMKKYWAAKR